MGIKGAPKTPGSGRKKGTLNKNTQAVADRCAALGLDPVEVAALFARGDWKKLGYKKGNLGPFGSPTIPPALRARCALDLVEFIHPKLKSVEFKGDADKPINLIYDTKWRALPPGGGSGSGDPDKDA